MSALSSLTSKIPGSQDPQAILHTGAAIVRILHASLLVLGAFFGGLFLMGFPIGFYLAGTGATFGKTALVTVGLWLIVWSVRSVYRGIRGFIGSRSTDTQVRVPVRGSVGDVSAVLSARKVKAQDETMPAPATKQTSLPKLALHRDTPAQFASVDS
jgi:hypothetical protein